jgi:hypothetical protein
VILANVSLFQLVRASRTCRSFREIYSRAMAAEQTARHDLVISAFGRQRITTIIDFILHLVNFGRSSPMYPEVYSISQDGVLHGSNPSELVNQMLRGVNEMSLATHPHSFMESRTAHVVSVIWPGLFFSVEIPLDLSGITMVVNLVSLDNAEGLVLGLAQVMLSKGLGKVICDAGKYCEVRVKQMHLGIEPGPPVLATLQAQVTPLLPFASRYIPAKIKVGGYYTECLQIGPVCPPHSEWTA